MLPNFLRPGFLLVTITLCVTFTAFAEQPLPEGYKLLHSQDFSNDSALKDFIFTDQKAWKISPSQKTSALELAAQSDYKPAVRSPVNIALIADKKFGDFILE